MAKRNILVTTALPYANGSIHLGHLLEHIQADIWVRFQQLQGHSCLFICGDDAHGTPIMLSASKKGITPEELVSAMQVEHQRDFNAFFINFDNFYTTHSAENRELSEFIYEQLKNRGDVFTKKISQAFDPVENIFLPDRFIRGECPRCNAADQYGDVCEVCGATYSPTELKNPKSAISGSKPIEKESEHFFFSLDHYKDLLETWVNGDHLQKQIANKLKEWFNDGLKPWDFSRDAPYFGFEIPNAPGKYFYVWLDAPIGYMASLKHLTQRRTDIHFDDYWNKNSKAELYHFVGKDIIYFHALFWPAMLHGAGFRMPTAIYVHGYLTINGQKMSKSRGTFITAHDYLKHLNPEYLRYYFAAKLTPQVEDIDLNFSDFSLRVNADLVGKYVNLASRCAGFITKKFNGQLSDYLPEPELFNEFVAASHRIANYFDQLNYNKAIREIMALTDRANQYIDQQKPWVLAKESANDQQIQAICTEGLNLFKVLSTYLKPILPETAKKVETFLNIPELSWQHIEKPLITKKINPFTPLLQRVSAEAVEALTTPQTDENQKHHC